MRHFVIASVERAIFKLDTRGVRVNNMHSQKLIAAICHGGWIPISAGVYQGIRVTGSLGIKDDLINAGAIWEDAAVVVDNHHVSSRKPDDLPEFCKGMLEVLTRTH